LNKLFVIARKQSVNLKAQFEGLDSPWSSEYVHKKIVAAGGSVATPAFLKVTEPKGDPPPL